MATLPPAVTPASPLCVPDAVVVQHNALINAHFQLSTLEMRLFLAMLRRIRRSDKVFAPCVIPVRCLAPAGSSHVPYTEVAQMVNQFAQRTLNVEVLGAEQKRQKKRQRGYASLPLLSVVSYSKAAGRVVACFNEKVQPYLLNLQDNFTKANLTQLAKLKSSASHRIYWLLKEYASFGQRKIELAELRNVLGLTTEYAKRFDHFCTRVLARAQLELARTDLPFTYEPVRQGRCVSDIQFFFAPVPTAPTPADAAPAAWQEQLLAAGVAKRSLPIIQTHLTTGYYEEDYIHYVLRVTRHQEQQGKVKNPPGAIYTALAEGYLLADYHAEKAPVGGRTKSASPQPGAAHQQLRRTKLEGDLQEAQASHQWLQSVEACEHYAQQYPTQPTVREQHLAEAAKKVTIKQQELQAYQVSC